MSFHFTGAGRTRAPVSLGGISTLLADPVQTAREQRLEREQQRRKQSASIRIQSQARRILESRQTRYQWQLQSRQLLEHLEADLLSRACLGSAEGLSRLVVATRILLVSLGPESRALDQSDAELFLRWIRLVLQSIDGIRLVFLPFKQPSQNAFDDSWLSLLRLACKHSLRFLAKAAVSRTQDASATPTTPTLDLEILAFLGLITGVDATSPANSISLGKHHQTLVTSLLSLLLKLGLHRTLRSHILSFTVQQKATATSLSSAVSLALAPIFTFKVSSPFLSKSAKAPLGASLKDAIALADEPEQKHSSALHRKAVHSFAVDIMTIPALRKRLPLNLITELAKHLPFSDLVDWLSSFYPDHIGTPYPQAHPALAASSQPTEAAQALSQPYLLANLLAFGSQRVSFFHDGPSLAKYLQALTNAQDWLPRSAFEPPTSSSTNKVNGTARKAPPPDAAETYERLRILVSDKHLAAILAISNRFPTSTRESLFAFICSAVSAWPLDMRDHVLNRLLYSGAESQGAQNSEQPRSLGPAGTGLIRDFWRGYVRGSPLARSLASAHDNTRAREILSSLSDPNTSKEWPALILVLEMLSKVLLTLGDDEFLPSGDDSFGVSDGGGARSNARWLSRDEILSISALLRNVAFAMYWYEGKAPLINLDGGDVDDPKGRARTPRVPGMRMTLLSLRTLMTTLLKQLHSRDSRHRFAPADHWLMLRAQQGARSRHLSALNLAFLSPRLGILNNVPFMIPFDVRVQIFRQFVQIDAVENGIYEGRYQRRRAVQIRRGHVAQDGFARLAPLGANLKKPLEIVFIDQFGRPEAGIDGGGLFKEFLTSLVREAFDTNRGLWKATDAQELYPNPHTYATSGEQLEWYEFLGRVIGKALYEGILVDAKFAGFFLSKMLGKQSFLDDLGSIDTLDKELYKGLISLKNYQGNVEDLSLNFTVTDEEFGVSMTCELIPGGANIPVTNLNRMEYIYRISHYRLSTQIQHQCNAFFNGLADMINPRWLRNFNREELSVLISGTDDPVDLEDLRKHTVLGGYHEQDLTVQHFWKVLEGFDQPMRKAFLKFVTSSPNPPLLGFGQLNPLFAIRKAGDDKSRLPTASTCVNLLKLPDYEDEQTCRDKLKYAIQSEAGFHLS
ncbi:hypothetical protein [Sporisorium scitamineum]|uniref:HECT-type E3 ubiquitin transferase n=1 Tax=Sporisorium scitamineum TaxID=49012 RepID=A0A0F7S512_9BASI|nr:hypothetical protein [Sporisorium scitamineum]